MLRQLLLQGDQRRCRVASEPQVDRGEARKLQLGEPPAGVLHLLHVEAQLPELFGAPDVIEARNPNLAHAALGFNKLLEVEANLARIGSVPTCTDEVLQADASVPHLSHREASL